jgi:hypothetical protein
MSWSWKRSTKAKKEATTPQPPPGRPEACSPMQHSLSAAPTCSGAAGQRIKVCAHAYRRGAATLLDFLDAERSSRATQLAYRQAVALPSNGDRGSSHIQTKTTALRLWLGIPDTKSLISCTVQLSYLLVFTNCPQTNCVAPRECSYLE